jgi:hypothetical protein
MQNDPGPLWQSSSRLAKSLELAAARKNAGPTQTNSTYLLATDKEKAANRLAPQFGEKNIGALRIGNVAITPPLLIAVDPATDASQKLAEQFAIPAFST